ncbi:esterase family protein [Penicillium robsamsonii]|uniref:esterase family protein n=1 Tax=Penicillium robsamsonii TaxID=1792511 RepID=UPI002546897B|nr:esterase family protein [Penicillium robsamsonii]KAJ5824723.1 esterase family protein [Penicillium robsamsonii]
MGGNDLGFSDIVWYCIITPNTARWGSTDRKNCVAAEDRARALMNDQGESGLRYKLSALYRSILDKAEQPDLSLFVTGFHYFLGGYKPPSDGWWPNRIVYHTSSLRTKLNLLVSQLNDLIKAAVQDVNSQVGSTNAYYVDVQQKFDTHRWCEQEIHEPDSSTANTYFFLGAWSDLRLGKNGVTSSDPEDMSSLRQAGISLPDASNCEETLGSDPDPYDKWLCLASIAINQDPNGPVAWSYGNATQDIKDGYMNTQHVSDWYPTRQIKTFRPRSPGMALYRDAILENNDATIGE